MAITIQGVTSRTLNRDKDSHRDYVLQWKLSSTTILDDPSNYITVSGLPAIGTTWTAANALFGGNGIDNWAFCLPTCEVAPSQSDDDGQDFVWTLTQHFSTRPLHRCQTSSIENPLNEPPRVGGTFIKYLEKALKDRHGDPLVTNTFERLDGSVVEFDNNRPTVDIEVTSLTLDLATVSSMVDTVNDANLWGLSPRKVKLSNFSWRRLLYGTCTYYYTMLMGFEVNFKTFDRTTQSYGRKWLHKALWSNPTQLDPLGSGLMAYENPANFVIARDEEEEPITIFHDEYGREADVTIKHVKSGTSLTTGPIADIDVEKYAESNFLLLGVPATL